MKKNYAELPSPKAFRKVALCISCALLLGVTLTSCNENQNILNFISFKASEPAELPIEEEEITDSTSDKKVIYLTFDDGPNLGTENLIQILNRRNVAATAFIIGQHAFASEKQHKDLELLRKNKLIELANHSYTHAHNKYARFYKNPEFVVQDFTKAKDSLKLNSFIARTPGRNVWKLGNSYLKDTKLTASDELEKAGFKLIGWDLEWKPNQNMKLLGTHEQMLKKVDSIFDNTLEKTHNHLVFLTHDQYLTNQESLQELDLFIEKLQKSNKFVFKKISAYPKINEVYN